MQSSSDEVVDIVEDMSKLFYERLKKLNLTDHYMASGYATLIRILMDTIAQNTSDLVAVRLMIVVLEKFSADHPGVNILIHEQVMPPKGKMQ